MSLELHPPVTVDKGTVVEERSDGLRSVAYIGDDVGDLPAFAALDRLTARGITAVKVAVRTPDASGPSSRRRTTWSTGPRARSTCSARCADACSRPRFARDAFRRCLWRPAEPARLRP